MITINENQTSVM